MWFLACAWRHPQLREAASIASYHGAGVKVCIRLWDGGWVKRAEGRDQTDQPHRSRRAASGSRSLSIPSQWPRGRSPTALFRAQHPASKNGPARAGMLANWLRHHQRLAQTPRPHHLLQPMQSVSSVQRSVRHWIAELKQCRTYWTDLNDDGSRWANQLANLALEKTFVAHGALWSPGLVDHPDLKELYRDKTTTACRPIQAALLSIVGKMEGQLRKMQTISFDIATLLTETCSTMGAKHGTQVPVFKTMSLENLCDAVRRVVSMYALELATKQAIVRELDNPKDRRHAMLSISAWVHQAHLLDEDLVEFDDMVQTETLDDQDSQNAGR
ncbi:uncharacterized protein BJ171DRAFT_506359 [Polychytrium aggregatum]|uniref:uncharacterized protein n=1 Tax=Polychytrium aggregatum TaxID=110093 RepID=UPI0022FF061A|nr:uncharacterized protein BJ171DRAFT_506359 [Polychytrium aggregatum]KAI9204178.1 hypothetical protein BJ171DRAFT_506359 [Polychytrium aggregatum]